MDKTALHVEWCRHTAAKYAVAKWHYSHRLPVGPLAKIGAWEHSRFVGAVVFGMGATPHLARPFCLLRWQVCELVRVALAPWHETPTSRIIAIAVRMFAKKYPHVELLVSYSDLDRDHIGVIYQACGWYFCGWSPGGDRYRDATGRLHHTREVSASGVSRQFGRATRVQRTGALVRVRTRGRYKYARPLTAKARALVAAIALPYPKDLCGKNKYPRAGSKAALRHAIQRGEGGATPTPALQVLKGGESDT